MVCQRLFSEARPPGLLDHVAAHPGYVLLLPELAPAEPARVHGEVAAAGLREGSRGAGLVDRGVAWGCSLKNNRKLIRTRELSWKTNEKSQIFIDKFDDNP